MVLSAENLVLTTRGGGATKFSLRLSGGVSAHVIAPCGSGKTRLARHICGLDHADGGVKRPTEVTLDGTPVRELPAKVRVATFGYLPPIPQLVISLVGRTLRQEMELGFAVLGRPVVVSNIESIAESLEIGPLLDRDPRDFSGGELVRTALACVLVKQPKVIVADQIGDQVDPEFREKLAGILHRWTISENGIFVHFTTVLREEFVRSGGTCVILNGDRAVSGPLERVWMEMGPAATACFDGVPRLAARFKEHGHLQDCEMPPNASDLASQLGSLRRGEAPEPKRTDEGEPDQIEAHAIDFRYPGSSFELHHVTLGLRKGELCAVMGHNGAGKTTLLKCLGNLIGPWSGKLSIGGIAHGADLPLPQTARKVLYAFQNPDDQLYRHTVVEELVECARNLRGRHYQLGEPDLVLAERFGLKASLNRSPFDLPLPERRLLVIASCLVARPSLLLLDEPTAWLDAQQKLALRDALAEFLSRGGASIMVSHDLDFVSVVASRLIFMSAGTIIRRVTGPMVSDEPLPYEPTCLKVSRRLPGGPSLWQEEPFLATFSNE